jgi:hypothetical protein
VIQIICQGVNDKMPKNIKNSHILTRNHDYITVMSRPVMTCNSSVLVRNRFGTSSELVRNRFGTSTELVRNRFGTGTEPARSRERKKESSKEKKKDKNKKENKQKRKGSLYTTATSLKCCCGIYKKKLKKRLINKLKHSACGMIIK